MKYARNMLIALVALCSAYGCSGQVETTDDSTRIEGEVPKIEVGDAPIDLDPSTDDDVDIDTPSPGDK